MRPALAAILLLTTTTACRKSPRRPPAYTPSIDASLPARAPVDAAATPDAAPPDAGPAHSLDEILERMEPCSPDPKKARGRFVHIVLSPAPDDITVGDVYVHSGDREFDACARKAALGAVLPGEFHPDETLTIRVEIER